MELKVLNIKGKETGRKVKLSADVFGIEPNDHAIYLDVKSHLANKRQGTHKSKERAEIKGSTRKIKKQKGTGTARAGSIKNPLFKGGGRVFGPTPRDYSQKVNKKVKRLARKSALSLKAKQKSIFIIEDFQLDKPQTQIYIKMLSALGLADKKSLLVLGELNKNVYLSSRNLKNSNVVISSELNTYGISNANSLIISESSITGLESLLNR
ncbi:MAG: 50S ribosomal protein L4 [Flavobacteriaceae bacterium]|jgi:large subunit ribosomal protein L4|nr:50S ribosomal protein L4 [Flavobacteriaceae bacterium]MDA9669862.1 50S ribosomal protein L4 [Flavobacteriaceae bacterium]MDG1251746.1 50S ribosomal protein L4 [Flavobacteriaceae bacterium]MDG1685870.1 50S ribosomal protein L4 [Flavobacteriaceae bacterium]MDG2235683.1 50S ribosomal protein L4 [Flavobacteriaceae bacterium]|tara:strand:- start:6098 stop:6727 length:630 start_codon:yes stop_codon:yes gene_type:complete